MYFQKSKLVVKTIFFLIFIFIIGCKNSAVSVNNDYKLDYESGAFFADWIYVNDIDDMQELGAKNSQVLNLDKIKQNWSTEFVMLKPKKLFSREKIGIFGYKIEFSPAEIMSIRKNGFFKCPAVNKTEWFRLNFKNSSNIVELVSDSIRFDLIERESVIESTKLKQLISFTTNNNYLFIFLMYSPSEEFQKNADLFKSILKTVSFESDAIQTSFENNESGFFTGLGHGWIWLLRWIYSWYEYIDVWPEHHTGFGYVLGFILGLLFLGGLSSLGKDN